MADRQMPNLKSRLELDTGDVSKARRDIDALRQTIAELKSRASASIARIDVATPARAGADALDALESSARSASDGVGSAADAAGSAADAVTKLGGAGAGAADALSTVGQVASGVGEAMQALRAGQSAAQGATSGLTSALTAGHPVLTGIAVGATAASAAIGLFGRSNEEAERKARALADALDDGIGRLNLAREVFAQAILVDEGSFFDDDQIALLARVGITVDDLREAALGNAEAWDRMMATIERSDGGLFILFKLGGAMEDFVRATQERAKAVVDAAIVDKQVTQELVNQLAATNRLRDGSVNWVAVQQEVQAAAESAAGAHLRAASAVLGLAGAYLEARNAAREAALAQLEVVNASIAASIGERQASLSVRAALEQIEEALGRGTRARATAAAAAKKQEDAERAVERATNQLADAEDRLTNATQAAAEKREALQRLLDGGLEQRQAAAQRELASAADRVADAEQRVVEARRRLAETEAGPSERDITRLRLDSQAAAQRLVAAEERLAQAKRQVERASLSTNERRRQAAQRELTDATIAYEEAQLRAADTAEKYDRALKFNADTSEDVAKARRDLERAERALADAQARETETQQKLTQELGPNLDGSVLLEKARRDLEKAERAVAGAQRDVERATRNLADAQDGRLTPATASARRAVIDLDQALASAEQTIYQNSLRVREAAERMAQLEGRQLSAGEAARIQRDYLIGVRDELAPDHPLRRNLDAYIELLNRQIPREVTTSINVDAEEAKRYVRETSEYISKLIQFAAGRAPFPGPPPPPPKPQSRAQGGSVVPGLPYWVNDGVKPEVFIPDVPGRMATIDTLTPAMGGVTVAEGAVQVNVSVQGTADEFDMRRLRRELRGAVDEALHEVLVGVGR